MSVEKQPWGSRGVDRGRAGGRAEGGYEHLQSQWPVAYRRMRPDCVGVPTPGLDDDMRFVKGVEDLPVQQFILQPPRWPQWRGSYTPSGYPGQRMDQSGVYHSWDKPHARPGYGRHPDQALCM